MKVSKREWIHCLPEPDDSCSKYMGQVKGSYDKAKQAQSNQ